MGGGPLLMRLEVGGVGDLQLRAYGLLQGGEQALVVREAARADGLRQLGLVRDAQPGQAGRVPIGLGGAQVDLPLDHGQHVDGHPGVEADPALHGRKHVGLQELADGGHQLRRARDVMRVDTCHTVLPNTPPARSQGPSSTARARSQDLSSAARARPQGPPRTPHARPPGPGRHGARRHSLWGEPRRTGNVSFYLGPIMSGLVCGHADTVPPCSAPPAHPPA
ncbi:hypothetical protein GCM10020001_091250 [Nonomuraea salmonea]